MALPYDANTPKLAELEDPLKNLKVVNVQPQGTSVKRKSLSLAKPTLQAIVALREQDSPIALTVPGHPGKKLTPNDSVLIRDDDPELNQIQSTGFTYDYNVKWSLRKCVRDLFQNFADSHGQTLAGTKITTKRASDGTYTVRITGDAEYAHEYVRDFISSKGQDKETAGGFGEGTKIMAFSLLKDHGADSIIFSSRNWALKYSGMLKRLAGNETPVMGRKLSKVKDQKGNYVEIKTRNPNLVFGIYQGSDLFYHPRNSDFDSPTVANEVGGFKYLGLDQKGMAKRGNIYPAMQRFEYKDPEAWDDSVEFVTLWTRQNVLKELGIVDRDRLALQPEQVKKIAKSIVKKMSNEDLMRAIFSLQDLWENESVVRAMGVDTKDPGTYHEKRENALEKTAGRILLKALLKEAASFELDDDYKTTRRIGARFPEKYVADTRGISNEVRLTLEKKGYKFCPYEFSNVGMITAQNKWKEIGRHQALSPTPQEVKQIQILKQAVSILAKYPKINEKYKGQDLITKEDIEKPIFIFNSTAKEETVDTNAEYAKTHIWYDRGYLQRASFSQALSIYCHEILHKFAGDGDADFGYALTNLLTGNFAFMLNMKSKDLKQLKYLEELWASQNSTQAPKRGLLSRK